MCVERPLISIRIFLSVDPSAMRSLTSHKSASGEKGTSNPLQPGRSTFRTPVTRSIHSRVATYRALETRSPVTANAIPVHGKKKPGGRNEEEADDVPDRQGDQGIEDKTAYQNQPPNTDRVEPIFNRVEDFAAPADHDEIISSCGSNSCCLHPGRSCSALNRITRVPSSGCSM